MALLGAPAQRIGYFGPKGGGIATLPTHPVDPGVFGLPGGPVIHGQPPVTIPEQPQVSLDQLAAAQAQQHQMAAQLQQHSPQGTNIVAALAALRGGPGPNLHNLLAAAAGAHPRPRAQVGRGLTEPTQLYHNPQTHLYPQLHANRGGAGY